MCVYVWVCEMQEYVWEGSVGNRYKLLYLLKSLGFIVMSKWIFVISQLFEGELKLKCVQGVIFF